MYVHWYFAEHFSELSCPFFSKSKGRILDELRVSFNKYVVTNCSTVYKTVKRKPRFISQRSRSKTTIDLYCES